MGERMANGLIPKFQRLRGMNSEELRHRLLHRWRVETERVRLYSRLASEKDRELESVLENHSFSIKSYLAGAPLRRFYPAAAQRERIVGFITHHFPEWLKRSASEAER